MEDELIRRVITKINADQLLEGKYSSLADLMSWFEIDLEPLLEVLRHYEDSGVLETRFGVDFETLWGAELEALTKPKAKKPKKVNPEEFDPMFILACNVILSSTDKRSTSAKLKAVGVSNAKWDAFLRIPKYREYFEKTLGQTFDRGEQQAKLSLLRNIESGDLQSIKHYQEYTGRFKPNQELTMNLNVILAKIMEILSRKLSPEDMIEIADSIELAIQPPKELIA